MEGISIVAVWGWMGSRIRLSIRARDPSIDLSAFLKKRFPKSSGAKLAPDGKGEDGALVNLGDLGMHIPETELGKVHDAFNASIATSILTDGE